MLDEPLGYKDGYPDYHSMDEASQIRAVLQTRILDFLKKLDKRI
jgi:hypothetical protein